MFDSSYWFRHLVSSVGRIFMWFYDEKYCGLAFFNISKILCLNPLENIYLYLKNKKQICLSKLLHMLNFKENWLGLE